jgi:hypothetical protein
MDPVTVNGQTAKGLELLFQKGELIPLKSIWFEVEEVGFDYMTLTPRSTTAGFQKRRDQ